MSDEMFDLSALENLHSDIVRLANDTMPREVKKFVQVEGNKLKRITLRNARKQVKEKTGKYHKSIKRGRTYKYRGNGAYAVRVYSYDHKAYLIENGHRIVTPGKKIEKGFKPGVHVFENSRKQFEKTYEKDCDQFLSKVIKGVF